MTCTHQTNLGQQWLQLRKERGKVACLEKAQSVEAVCGTASQSKTCTAKTILFEPQFAAAYPRSGVAERLTRHIGLTGGTTFMPLANRHQNVDGVGKSARPTHPLYEGASERTGRLGTSHLLARVITGCPTAGIGSRQWPVWVRSRHSIQMPSVTAGTAISISMDARRYKCGATHMNVAARGRRAAVSTIQTQSTEAC